MPEKGLGLIQGGDVKQVFVGTGDWQGPFATGMMRAAMNRQAELKERVLASVRQMPSPVRSSARRESRGVVVAAFAVAVTLFFAVDGLHHARGRPTWFVATSVTLWAVVALCALRAAWRGGVAFGAGSITSLATAVIAPPAFLLASSLAFVWIDPELALLHSERIGLKCFGMILAAAVCPLLGLSRARRSSDPMHPVASGAALGVATGACAGAMVGLWCPVAAPIHVLIGHILPMGALALIGGTLSARMIAMRPGSSLSV